MAAVFQHQQPPPPLDHQQQHGGAGRGRGRGGRGRPQQQQHQQPRRNSTGPTTAIVTATAAGRGGGRDSGAGRGRGRGGAAGRGPSPQPRGGAQPQQQPKQRRNSAGPTGGPVVGPNNSVGRAGRGRAGGGRGGGNESIIRRSSCTGGSMSGSSGRCDPPSPSPREGRGGGPGRGRGGRGRGRGRRRGSGRNNTAAGPSRATEAPPSHQQHQLSRPHQEEEEEDQQQPAPQRQTREQHRCPEGGAGPTPSSLSRHRPPSACIMNAAHVACPYYANGGGGGGTSFDGSMRSASSSSSSSSCRNYENPYDNSNKMRSTAVRARGADPGTGECSSSKRSAFSRSNTMRSTTTTASTPSLMTKDSVAISNEAKVECVNSSRLRAATQNRRRLSNNGATGGVTSSNNNSSGGRCGAGSSSCSGSVEGSIRSMESRSTTQSNYMGGNSSGECSKRSSASSRSTMQSATGCTRTTDYYADNNSIVGDGSYTPSLMTKDSVAIISNETNSKEECGNSSRFKGARRGRRRSNNGTSCSSNNYIRSSGSGCGSVDGSIRSMDSRSTTQSSYMDSGSGSGGGSGASTTGMPPVPAWKTHFDIDAPREQYVSPKMRSVNISTSLSSSSAAGPKRSSPGQDNNARCPMRVASARPTDGSVVSSVCYSPTTKCMTEEQKAWKGIESVLNSDDGSVSVATRDVLSEEIIEAMMLNASIYNESPCKAKSGDASGLAFHHSNKNNNSTRKNPTNNNSRMRSTTTGVGAQYTASRNENDNGNDDDDENSIDYDDNEDGDVVRQVYGCSSNMSLPPLMDSSFSSLQSEVTTKTFATMASNLNEIVQTPSNTNQAPPPMQEFLGTITAELQERMHADPFKNHDTDNNNPNNEPGSAGGNGGISNSGGGSGTIFNMFTWSSKNNKDSKLRKDNDMVQEERVLEKSDAVAAPKHDDDDEEELNPEDLLLNHDAFNRGFVPEDALNSSLPSLSTMRESEISDFYNSNTPAKWASHGDLSFLMDQVEEETEEEETEREEEHAHLQQHLPQHQEQRTLQQMSRQQLEQQMMQRPHEQLEQRTLQQMSRQQLEQQMMQRPQQQTMQRPQKQTMQRPPPKQMSRQRPPPRQQQQPKTGSPPKIMVMMKKKIAPKATAPAKTKDCPTNPDGFDDFYPAFSTDEADVWATTPVARKKPTINAQSLTAGGKTPEQARGDTKKTNTMAMTLKEPGKSRYKITQSPIGRLRNRIPRLGLFTKSKGRRGSPTSIVDTGRKESKFYPNLHEGEEQWGGLLAG